MHTAKHIEMKQLSDGAIAVKTQCCQDKSTDSCLTIYVGPETTEGQVKTALDEHATRIQNQHEAVTTHLQTVARLTGLTVVADAGK